MEAGAASRASGGFAAIISETKSEGRKGCSEEAVAVVGGRGFDQVKDGSALRAGTDGEGPECPGDDTWDPQRELSPFASSGNVCTRAGGGQLPCCSVLPVSGHISGSVVLPRLCPGLTWLSLVSCTRTGCPLVTTFVSYWCWESDLLSFLTGAGKILLFF